LFTSFTDEISTLCYANGTLFAGTQNGLFEIRSGLMKKNDAANVSNLYYSDKLKLLFVAEKNGLVIYEHSAEWEKKLEIPRS